MKNYLSQLKALIESMILYCEQENWEAFAEKEKQRQNIMMILSEGNISNPDHIELLEDIVKLNKQLIDKADQRKEESSQALLALKRRLKNSEQYKK